MRIVELFERGQPVFSFEFFPPKTDAGYRSLYRTIGELKRLDPGFVSVTCGAAGSTRQKTTDLVIRIQQELGVTAMAHMVCTGSPRAELAETLERMQREGLENVLALRGDAPRDQPGWKPVAGGFRHADELTAFIAEHFELCIGGACYPEKHPEAASFDEDLTHLRSKVDAGAAFLVTQLFFDDADYFTFVERVRKAGIRVPIVPGVMPLVGLANLRRIAALSPGSKIPAALEADLEAADGDAAASLDVGVRFATAQCRELLAGGAPGIHFYTLNQSPATRRVHQQLAAT